MTATPHHRPKPSLLGSLLRLPIQVAGWITLCWLFAQFMLLMIFLWQGHPGGLMQTVQLLDIELNSVVNQTVHKPYLYDLWQNIITFTHMLQQYAAQIPLTTELNAQTNNKTLQKLLALVYPPLTDYARATIAMMQVILLRLTTVCLFAPLFSLLAVLGFIGGLVQRYLRRINGGRESALIYHYAKISIKPCLFCGSLLYVALPFRVEPTTYLLPCAIGCALAISLTTKTFKKYC